MHNVFLRGLNNGGTTQGEDGIAASSACAFTCKSNRNEAHYKLTQAAKTATTNLPTTQTGASWHLPPAIPLLATLPAPLTVPVPHSLPSSLLQSLALSLLQFLLFPRTSPSPCPLTCPILPPAAVTAAVTLTAARPRFMASYKFYGNA